MIIFILASLIFSVSIQAQNSDSYFKTVPKNLTDAPDWMIEAEKRKLYYGMGGDNADMAAYQKAAEQVERNMRFGDIPEADRVKCFDIERDEQWEIDLAERILKAREI